MTKRKTGIPDRVMHAMYELSKAYDEWLDDSEDMADADLIDAVRLFVSQVEPLIRREIATPSGESGR